MAKKHLIFAVAATMLLASCSSTGNASSEPAGDLTVLTNRTDLVDTVFQDYKKEFEALYPDVNVEFEAITDYEPEVNTRLSTGDYGDVLLIPSQVKPDQFSQFFEPLGQQSDLAEKYRFLNDKSFEGVQYGIPTFGSANGLVYNKKVWADAGVDEIPTTPEEFVSALEMIKANTDAIPYYTNYKDVWPLSQWQGVQGVVAGSTAVADRDESDEPWAKGSEQYVIDSLIYDIVEGGLSEDDPLTTAWEGSKAMIGSGEVATMLLGSWSVVQMQDAAETAGADRADIGYMPFPYQTDGKYNVNVAGDFNSAINVNSENKVTARAWIDWFTDESGYYELSGALPTAIDGDLPSTLADFDALDINFVELEPSEDPTLDANIYNEAGIDLFGGMYRQPLIDIARGAADGDKESYFESLNQKWADARAAVGS
ncbi:ABC-type glycerol-3-phosphate transport system substrate-binding protein [Salinibacterium sp. CAN_S4]|uniref:ABC transporter substrate-binding protein n=1 Tax=Salinibacterium sp. CAN_S4 TaxID=2787727 RepID=UPI0018F02642